MNRSISLDDSYSEGYSNQSLKKYVAKKTVQEQAFRGKDTVSSGDLKAVIGQKASVVSAVSTASTVSGDLFGKTDTSSTQKGSGLFSNVAQPKSGEPDILTKAIAEKNQANTTASTSDTEKKPASSLFSNITSTSQDQKKTTTEDANKGQNSVSKSLFGDSGSTTSSLFGPGAGTSKPTTSNTSTTVQASTEEPKLSKAESTIQVIFIIGTFLYNF